MENNPELEEAQAIKKHVEEIIGRKDDAARLRSYEYHTASMSQQQKAYQREVALSATYGVTLRRDYAKELVYVYQQSSLWAVFDVASWTWQEKG